MTRGSIVKVVDSFGSKWGMIQPRGGGSVVFFNVASLSDAVEFAALTVGQEVEFDEQADQVTGVHAQHLIVVVADAEQARA